MGVAQLFVQAQVRVGADLYGGHARDGARHGSMLANQFVAVGEVAEQTNRQKAQRYNRSNPNRQFGVYGHLYTPFVNENAAKAVIHIMVCPG
jgi:cysteine sulfinate desulfinase/cysteine desulfurase-like protein